MLKRLARGGGFARRALIVGTVATLVVVPSVSVAQETATYTYDALGRLTNVANSGGPNSGTTVATGFDPAGNRTQYATVKPAARAAATAATREVKSVQAQTVRKTGQRP